MAKRRKAKKSRRKTFKLKRTALRAASGKEVYKVIGGWRVARARKRKRRKSRKRRRKRRSKR